MMTEKKFRERYSFSLRRDKLGQGRFGKAYKGRDNVSKKGVAIKVAEVKFFEEQEFSLQKEFLATQKLQPHANIANCDIVYRFESLNDVFDFSIMDLYRRGNLGGFLKNRKLRLDKKEKLIFEILDGIEYLHNQKIIHRNLKPSNILIEDKKGEFIPKITDFGMTKQAEERGNFINRFVSGTLQYSSPEQLKGEHIEFNTDLWSFGVIAYEILTGKILFEVNNINESSTEWKNEIINQILHSDLESKLQDLLPKWKRVISSCLERSNIKRVKTPDEVRIIAENKPLNNNDSIASESDLPQKEPIVKVNPVVEKVDPIKKINPIHDRPTYKPRVKPEFKVKPEPKAKFEPNLKFEPSPRAVVKNKNETVKLIGIIGTSLLLGAGIMYAVLTPSVKNYFVGLINKYKEVGIITYQDKGLYGYKTERGDVLIPAGYLTAENFIEDKAKVSTIDSVFYINKAGGWISTIEKSMIDEISDSLVELDSVSLSKKQIEIDLDKQSWETASKKNTITTYKAYLKVYPNGNNSEEAKRRILILVDKSIKKKVEPVVPVSIVQKEKSTELDDDAQYNLGAIAEKNGEHFKAREWYTKAAEQGNIKAQYSLANIYLYGIRVGKDEEKGIYWYVKAAEQGNVMYKYKLATIYFEGNDIAKDDLKAMRWYKEAAKLGHPKSQEVLTALNEEW